MEFTRYALYYLPPAEAAWARFATGWLGWDIQACVAVAHPSVDGLPLPVCDLTRTPRRYGLHATLKPPFRLAEGLDRAALESACADLCAALAPVRLQGLALTRMGRFLALRPVGPQTALNALAAACVRGLDRFRAPMDNDDHARRAAGLTPRLAANLNDWGYPHVMDAFRFHITLTGRLAEPDLATTEAALTPLLAPLLPSPFAIADLALVGEAADGMFHLLRRFPLSGQEQPAYMR